MGLSFISSQQKAKGLDSSSKDKHTMHFMGGVEAGLVT